MTAAPEFPRSSLQHAPDFRLCGCDPWRLGFFRPGLPDAVALLEHTLRLSGRILNQRVHHKAGIVCMVPDIVFCRERGTDLLVVDERA